MPENPWGQPIKIADFSRGLGTKTAPMYLPEGYSPYCKNVWYDEENALTRMPGISAVVNTSSYGAPAVYGMHRYVTPSGQEFLIIHSDVSGTGRIGYMVSGDSAIQDMTPDGGIAASTRISFANYRGKLYMWNGTDPLRIWDTSEWIWYHGGRPERFSYLTVYDGCLYAARSGVNPQRVIYTGKNECHFAAPWWQSYFGGTQLNWMDFPTPNGDPVTGIFPSPWGTLLVFKVYSIHEVRGSPVDDTHSKHDISLNVGCVSHWGIQAIGHNVFFPGLDGIYMLGPQGVKTSQQDRELQIEQNTIRISSEMDDFWEDHLEIPAPHNDIRETIQSGDGLTGEAEFTSGGTYIPKRGDIFYDGSGNYFYIGSMVSSSSYSTWAAGTATGTLYGCNTVGTLTATAYHVNTDSGADSFTLAEDAAAALALNPGHYSQVNVCPFEENPTVMNYSFPYISGLYDEPSNADGSRAHRLFSTTDANNADEHLYTAGTNDWKDDIWYAEQLTAGGAGNATIPDLAMIKVKKNGTMTSSMKLRVLVCDAKRGTDNVATEVEQPDLSHQHASAELSLDYLETHSVLAFDAGTTQIPRGSSINGKTSGATAVVQEIVVTSGSWTGNDAAGWMFVTNVSGTWQDGEKVRISTSEYADTDGTCDAYGSTTAKWLPIHFSYWDYPQNLYDGIAYGYGGTHPTKYFVFMVRGTDDSNYISVVYNTGGGLSNAQMLNKDSDSCAGEANWADDDWVIQLWYNGFHPRTAATLSRYAACITDTLDISGDADRTDWGNVTVTVDTSTLNGYTRSSDISKLYVRLSQDGSTWTGYGAVEWYEVNHGDRIEYSASTYPYMQVQVRFTRPYCAWNKIDSFSLLRVRATYYTLSIEQQLMNSAVWDNRYWLTCKKYTDPEEPS